MERKAAPSAEPGAGPSAGAPFAVLAATFAERGVPSAVERRAAPRREAVQRDAAAEPQAWLRERRRLSSVARQTT